jgi:hypothetical protein
VLELLAERDQQFAQQGGGHCGLLAFTQERVHFVSHDIELTLGLGSYLLGQTVDIFGEAMEGVGHLLTQLVQGVTAQGKRLFLVLLLFAGQRRQLLPHLMQLFFDLIPFALALASPLQFQGLEVVLHMPLHMLLEQRPIISV